MRPPGFIFILLLASATFACAEVLAEYDANKGAEAENPVDIGWKKLGGDAAIAGASGDASGGWRAWKIGDASSNVNQLIYRFTLPKRMAFQNWKASAKLQVQAASAGKVKDAFLEVQDGRSEWGIAFAKTNQGREEIGYIDQDGTWQSLYMGDISSAPFEIQLEYFPNADVVKVSVNGKLLEKEIARSDVAPVGRSDRFFISWGDAASDAKPSDARSEVDWQLVKFELVN